MIGRVANWAFVLHSHRAPGRCEFNPSTVQTGETFDPIMCEGSVRRSHTRADYREPQKMFRLAVAQSALGLEHA